jgi:hypothetical protein
MNQPTPRVVDASILKVGIIDERHICMHESDGSEKEMLCMSLTS